MSLSSPLRALPPAGVGELLARARALTGCTLDELALALKFPLAGAMVHRKGKAGELLERALGASGGSSQVHDFPTLGVELKTVPVDAQGAPRESTFVCAFSLLDADREEWVTSWVRAKLSHVLWVPLVHAEDTCTVGAPVLWQPSAEQEAALRADFEDIMGLIGTGQVEQLTAHVGQWLQARPKAAHGRVRTLAYGYDGERLQTVPRGFYLRPRFTRAVLAEPGARFG